MKRKQQGFTILELVVVIVFLGVAFFIITEQLREHHQIESDKMRKISINAIYYSLEEGYYKQNGYYPKELSEDKLKTLDPELLKDPEGKKINEKDSSFKYEPTNCDNEKCKSYLLSTIMKKEADYQVKSKH